MTFVVLVKLIDALNKMRSLLNTIIYWMNTTQLHRLKYLELKVKIFRGFIIYCVNNITWKK